MMEVIHHRLVVSGKVQGVFFRKHTCAKAVELGLAGYVMNQPDGSVCVEAEGSLDALQALLTWCSTGPPQARVDHVEVTTVPFDGMRGFEVRY